MAACPQVFDGMPQGHMTEPVGLPDTLVPNPRGTRLGQSQLASNHFGKPSGVVARKQTRDQRSAPQAVRAVRRPPQSHQGALGPRILFLKLLLKISKPNYRNAWERLVKGLRERDAGW